MKPVDVVQHFGGTQTKAASGLGLCQTTVSSWCRQGHIPLGRQYMIQVLTAGHLKADPSLVPPRKRKTVDRASGSKTEPVSQRD